MARITVEDCLGKLGNRFELVIAASRRARQLALGSVDALVPWDGDKPTVVALREIAAGLVDENGDVVKQESDIDSEAVADESAVEEESSASEGSAAV